ncbi:MAG: hypothetical protein NTZ05_19415 [Chloroflexi bacterium]|nr:hypothetical protein [Chloroflexota bacterium]
MKSANGTTEAAQGRGGSANGWGVGDELRRRQSSLAAIENLAG